MVQKLTHAYDFDFGYFPNAFRFKLRTWINSFTAEYTAFDSLLRRVSPNLLPMPKNLWSTYCYQCICCRLQWKCQMLFCLNQYLNFILYSLVDSFFSSIKRDIFPRLRKFFLEIYAADIATHAHDIDLSQFHDSFSHSIPVLLNLSESFFMQADLTGAVSEIFAPI